jgi:putrescine transport system permease protein
MLVGVFVVLYAPLLYLCYASVNANELTGAWRGFTTRWYRSAWTDPAVRAAFGRSVRLAAVAAVGATLIGTLSALATRRAGWWRRVMGGVAAGRVGTPEVIIATGLGVLLPLIDVRLGFGPMAVAHVAYLSAFVALIVGARAAGADPSHEDAAADLGAKRWQVLRHVVVPDVRPAIASSALLVAAFSFDDLALSLALRGPDDDTLPVYLFSVVQRRVTPSIHAIGVLVVVVGLMLSLAAVSVNRALVVGRPNAAR